MKNENEREELKKYIYDNFEIEEGTERACTFSLSALTLAAELGYGKAHDDISEGIVTLRQIKSSMSDVIDMKSRRIKELEEQNKLLIEALSFYASPENWIERTSDSWDRSDPRYKGDLELIKNYKHPKTDWKGTVSVGGKRAREALQKIKDSK